MTRRVAVVGAGLAGLAAARELAGRGHDVRLFERHSAPGGRLSSRRFAGVPVDAGAPAFTVRDPRFREALDGFVGAGRLRPWAERLHRWNGHELRADPLTRRERRWAAPGGFADLLASLGEGLVIDRDSRVTRLTPDGAGWRLDVQIGENPEEIRVPADVVVVAVPAPPALALAETAAPALEPLVLAELRRVTYDPCLVAFARYDAPRPPWEAIAAEAGPIQWIGAESTKRPSGGLVLAIHASGEWSAAHRDTPEAEVVAALLAETARITGLANPCETALQRWPHARPTQLASAWALLSETPPIAFCGDWAVAPRVEGAFLSGLAAAERLVGAGHA